MYDYKRYVKNTFIKNSERATIAMITSNCHSIEKGFTLSPFRFGFATRRITDLMEQTNIYIERYGMDNVQIKYVIDTLHQYRNLHIGHENNLTSELLSLLNDFTKKYPSGLYQGIQLSMNGEAYFAQNHLPFDQFSMSRHSLRHFDTGSISVEQIETAIALANNSPSACNRQPNRVYVVTQKTIINRILELQIGNRGFGEYFDKLLIITGFIGGYCGSIERNTVFIDTGIYAMNLLYSLHFNKIGACILNWSGVQDVDLSLRTLLHIPEDEKISVLIGCGQVPKQFKVCLSRKKDLQSTIKII